MAYTIRILFLVLGKWMGLAVAFIRVRKVDLKLCCVYLYREV